MTNPEFSREFDILYNSITSNQAPGLDDYEKSVILTIAQKDVLTSYFSARKNKYQQGFDESKERQIDFSNLTKVVTLTKSESPTKFDSRSVAFRKPFDMLDFINESCTDGKLRYSVLPLSYAEYDRLMLKPFPYPPKRCIWRILTDSPRSTTGSTTWVVNNGANKARLQITNSSPLNVTMVFSDGGKATNLQGISTPGIGWKPTLLYSKDDLSVTINCRLDSDIHNSREYWAKYLINNEEIAPYIGDSETLVFPNVSLADIDGVMVEAEAAAPLIELIGKFDEDTLKYKVRYLRKPRPIILVPLETIEEGLSIEGRSDESECELAPSLHYAVLQRGVEIAKAVYLGDLPTLVALGQSSKTDIGIIPQAK